MQFSDVSKTETAPIFENRIFCLTIPTENTPWKFFYHSFLIFIFFISFGFLLELIFRLEGFKPFGLYLALSQFVFYVFFSSVEKCLRNEQRKIPMRLYALLALVTAGTTGFSQASIGYLNYPTQVIFKCCQLVPVMIGGILIQGKRYNFLDFLSAILMSVGLILFTLADSKVSPNFNIIGVVLISSALAADAVIGNIQEKYLKQYTASNSEMILYSHCIGIVYLLVILICIGQLEPAFKFCFQHPYETYGYCFLLSFCGYCGITVILSMVKSYGAFTTVTVTTFRKALTIILSFIIFSKPFTFQYLWSGLIVVCGVYLNVYNNILRSKQGFNIWILFQRLYKWFQSFKIQSESNKLHSQPISL